MEKRKAYHSFNEGRPERNGIACPTCGKELYDESPCQILTSSPPHKWVICKACNYRGLRVA